MANILVPERYSHDKLRDRLQKLESIALHVDKAIYKEDYDAAAHFWEQHRKACDDFKQAFEEHDNEMQFVDKLVEAHEHERLVNESWSKKWKALERAGIVIGSIVAITTLYLGLK